MVADPVNLTDPSGTIIPVLLLAWGAVELGLTLYDIYDAWKTLGDPCASDADKAISGGGLLLGALVPGGGYGALGKKAGKSLLRKKASSLADDALVCRGGTCTAERFRSGSGVWLDEAGRLQDVSVNSAPGKSLAELTQAIPNRQVGVTTVGQVRAAGGDVVASPTAWNPDHCLLCGITPEQAEFLFTPTMPNPNR